MFPASLLPELAPHPFHVQLMSLLVVGSGVLCLAVVAIGALSRRWRHDTCHAEGLPPLPSTFPYTLDQVYTVFFMLLILWGTLDGLLTTEAETTEEGKWGWSLFLLGLTAQVGIYLPMLLRYGLLHPMQRPTRPWWHYLGLPALFWLIICTSCGLLELSGFSSWVVRATGCPEYQDVVLLFRQGEPLQQLYIAICAIFIAPVTEECCFRGFLYTSLKRWGGRVAAAVASGILFGAIHGSIAQMLPLTIFGIVQCIAYEKTRSLWLPIAIHMLFNTTSLIATCVMMP